MLRQTVGSGRRLRLAPRWAVDLCHGEDWRLVGQRLARGAERSVHHASTFPRSLRADVWRRCKVFSI